MTKRKLSIKQRPTHHNRGKTFDFFKPEKFKEYVTVTELSRIVEKDVRWIKRLEAAGRIPRAQRHKGTRLWSPAQVEEIQDHFANVAIGRPAKES